MTTLTSLKVDLELTTAKFDRNAEAAKSRINGIGKQSSIAASHLKAMFGAASVAGFAALVKGSLNAANHLNDLTARIGVTAEGLSRLQYAAKVTGVSTQTLEMGLQRATRRIAEAAQGSGEAVGALSELGLSAEKLSQAKPDEQFKVLADALNKVPNQADKVRLAMKLLDSEGVALLQTMEGGSAAINALGEEADKTGATISTKFAQQATAANAAMIKVGAVTTGLTNQLTVALAPTLESIANFMSGVMPTAIEWTSRAFNGLRATIAFVVARSVEALRSVTYPLSFISDTFADADKALSDLQNSLDATAEGFANKVIKAADETATLDIKTGEVTKTFQDYVGVTQSAAAATKELADAKRDAASVQKQRDKVETDFEGVQESLMTEEELLINSYAKRQAIVAEFAGLGAENQEIANQTALELAEEFDTEYLALKQKTADEEAKIEQSKQNAINTMRLGAVNSAIGFFKVLAGNSKTAAKIMLGIETAFKVQQVLQNTAVAATRAMSDLGPVAGPPAAASITGWGYAQAAFVAAQGVLSVGKSGGGGTSAPSISTGGSNGGSTPAIPTIPESSSGGSGGNTYFIFQGPVGTSAELFLDEIKDEIQNGLVFIESGTEQALELTKELAN